MYEYFYLLFSWVVEKWKIPRSIQKKLEETKFIYSEKNME